LQRFEVRKIENAPRKTGGKLSFAAPGMNWHGADMPDLRTRGYC
jgi:hypothetical protein